MIKLIKKMFGIKEYLTCPTCQMVYEPDGGMFNGWCPEHRKPHIELYELEQWAKRWARNHPEEAKKIKAADDAEMNKIRAIYNQELGKAINSEYAKQQSAGLQNTFGGLGGMR